MDFYGNIDNHTLLLLSIFILILMNLFLLIMRTIYSKINGLGYAVIGNVFLILSIIVMCFMGLKDYSYLTVLVSVCNLLGISFLVNAIFVFFNRKINFKKYFIINILCLLSAIVFVYIYPDLSLRRAFVSFFIFLIFVDGSNFLKSKYHENNLDSYKVIRNMLYIFAVYYFIRIFVSLAIDSDIVIVRSNIFLNITLVLFIFSSILITFAFAFMTIDTLFHDVKKLSVIDSLTGLHNRRYLYLNLENLMKELKRGQCYFLIVFVDIDNFKGVNDSYGHNTGDKVLQWFSSLLKINLRDVDIVVRYGGDEFIAVLKDTSIEDGYNIFERILHETRRTKWEHEDCKITFSGSIMCVTPEHSYKDMDELINDVDTKMYSAKGEGRDRILIF